MTTATAIAGFNTQLKIGDGGVGAGAKAQVEWGTTTAKIRIKAKSAGTAGNGSNVTVAVSGSSFVTTSITATEVSITAPTTATVAMVVAYLYTNSTFDTYFDADYGATPGDGTGTITARTVTATSGGTDGTEAFTLIGDVTSIKLAGRNRETVDVTHMTSTDGFREFISTLRDSGTIDFEFNAVPGNASLLLIEAAYADDSPVNFQIVWPNGVIYQMAALVVSGPDIGAVVDDKVTGSCSIKITGPVDTDA